jgi:hypothetical protein
MHLSIRCVVIVHLSSVPFVCYQMAHLEKSELIYANFSNDISIRPYAVFVDFEKHVSDRSA